jgi:hypothetical protein
MVKTLNNSIHHKIRPLQKEKVYDDPYKDERIEVVLHLPREHINILNERNINPSDLCYRLIHTYISEYDKNILFIDELMKLFSRQEKIFKEIYKIEGYKKELDFIEHEIEILLDKVHDTTNINMNTSTFHNDIKFIYRKVENGFTPSMLKQKYPNVIKRIESYYHDFDLDRWVYNVYLCLPKSKRNDYKRKYEEMVMEWIKKYNGK